MQSCKHILASNALYLSMSSILDTVDSSKRKLEWRKDERRHQVYDAEVELDEGDRLITRGFCRGSSGKEKRLPYSGTSPPTCGRTALTDPSGSNSTDEPAGEGQLVEAEI